MLNDVWSKTMNFAKQIPSFKDLDPRSWSNTPVRNVSWGRNVSHRKQLERLWWTRTSYNDKEGTQERGEKGRFKTEILRQDLQSGETEKKRNGSLIADLIAYDFLVSVIGSFHSQSCHLSLECLSAPNSPFSTCSAIMDLTSSISPLQEHILNCQ